MSGAETARRRVVQRRVDGAETAAPKCPSPNICYHTSELSVTQYLLLSSTQAKKYSLEINASMNGLTLSCIKYPVLSSRIYHE